MTIMMRKELLVKSVTYGKEKAEIVSVNLENKNREMMTIIATFVRQEQTRGTEKDMRQ